MLKSQSCQLCTCDELWYMFSASGSNEWMMVYWLFLSYTCTCDPFLIFAIIRTKKIHWFHMYVFLYFKRRPFCCTTNVNAIVLKKEEYCWLNITNNMISNFVNVTRIILSEHIHNVSSYKGTILCKTENAENTAAMCGLITSWYTLVTMTLMIKCWYERKHIYEKPSWWWKPFSTPFFAHFTFPKAFCDYIQVKQGLQSFAID